MARDDRMSAAPDAPNVAAVCVRSLARGFGPQTVLDGVDLEIPPGQFVALLGYSGSGKSTLLRAAALLDHGAQGGGTVEVPYRRAVVFQDARLVPWMRVLENVILGLPTRGEAGRAARAAGRGALAEVGLAAKESAWPRTLSGGEGQRAALARALVRDPELMLLDEPFGALDALTRIRMHELLRALCAAHRPAVLLVTHDVDEALSLADRVLVLSGGRIVLDRTLEALRPGGLVPDSASTDYRELRRELLAELGVGRAERPAPAA